MDERVAAQVAPLNNPPWHRRPELLAIVALVLLAHLPRLTAIPVCGEESRWATVARGMIETGDWIVPRQQGQVFPDRPPLGVWPIAAIASLRGEVDALAIRLPSVIAVMLTSVVVFAYGSMFLSRLGAALTALLYPTMGHVLQLGGLGESDAQFTFYVAASLLVWHAGYMQKISAQWVWSAGYALAAAGALVKGLQAPVYFVAATWLWLAIQRDWRYLLNWRHAVGMLAFVAVIGAWQIPYILATDVSMAMAMWSKGPAERFVLDGLLKHMASYPLETFATLLPWSPLLLLYSSQRFRKSLDGQRSHAGFLITAAAVCYLPLWLAAGARGRYFMPLYPCMALLMGVALDQLVTSMSGAAQQQFWRRYAWTMSAVVLLAGIAVGMASTQLFPRLTPIAQPAMVAVIFTLIAAAALATLAWSARRVTSRGALAGAITLMLFVVAGSKLVITNVTLASANDLSIHLAQVKEQLPGDAKLVSFTAVNHRFDHYYGQAIDELPWPSAASEIPADVEHFCFVRHPGDTPEQRTAGRMWNHYTTPGELPFAWEEIATVSMARRQDDNSQPVVIVGRIVREDEQHVADLMKDRESKHFPRHARSLTTSATWMSQE